MLRQTFAASSGVIGFIALIAAVQPTTLAGVAALLHHVGRGQWLGFDTTGILDETVLSVLTHGGRECPFGRAAQEFPVRLAETLLCAVA
jgi:hypothetical protein